MVTLYVKYVEQYLAIEMVLIQGTNNNDYIGSIGSSNEITNPSSDDVIYAGGGDDDVYLRNSSGRDTVSGGTGDDTIIGFGDDLPGAVIFGESGDDYIAASAGESKLYGGDGADIVSGGKQADSLFGGSDNDILGGGESNDRLYGEEGNDFITGGYGSDTLVGGNGDDTLVGLDNTLFRDDVNSIELGRRDKDTMYGGGGRDVFALDNRRQESFYMMSGEEDVAYIEDFELGEDVIRLDGVARDYVLGVNSDGDTEIYVDTDGAGSGISIDLIAVVKNTQRLNLNSTIDFYYV